MCQILLLFFLFINKNLLASSFIDKGYYVIDLKNKIEWLKCSAGQQWSDKKIPVWKCCQTRL